MSRKAKNDARSAEAAAEDRAEGQVAAPAVPQVAGGEDPRAEGVSENGVPDSVGTPATADALEGAPVGEAAVAEGEPEAKAAGAQEGVSEDAPAASGDSAGEAVRWPTEEELDALRTPRALATWAAEVAAMAVQSAVDGRPGDIVGMTFREGWQGVLDRSPDIPASALVTFIVDQEGAFACEAAAEALRAAYVGLQPWVKAEEARRAPPPAPLLRKGRYEKSGRVDPAPERIYSAAERERIRRNREDAAKS